MHIPRIYLPDVITEHSELLLPAEATNHVANVLRSRVGDNIILFNDTGHEYPAVISAITKRKVTVQVSTAQAVSRESPLKIHLIQAVARGEKMDWIVQKATELGVQRITPVMTEYSNVKLNQERQVQRVEHWRLVAINAAEQCGRTQLPEIMPVINFNQLLQQKMVGTAVILHPAASETLKHNVGIHDHQLQLLIGPEGGFAENELQHALKAGYQAISFGPRILRTETAAVAAIAACQAYFGDLG